MAKRIEDCTLVSKTEESVLYDTQQSVDSPSALRRLRIARPRQLTGIDIASGVVSWSVKLPLPSGWR